MCGLQDSAGNGRDKRPTRNPTAPEETPGPFRRPPSVPGPLLRGGNRSLATARRQTSPDPGQTAWAWSTKVLDRVICSARSHQVRADSSRGQSTQEGRIAARAKGLKTDGLPSQHPDATQRHSRLHRTSLQPGGPGRCDRCPPGRADGPAARRSPRRHPNQTTSPSPSKAVDSRTARSSRPPSRVRTRPIRAATSARSGTSSISFRTG